MQRKRSQWIETISGANAEHQIYLDESGINTNFTRHYAHAVHGKRAIDIGIANAGDGKLRLPLSRPGERRTCGSIRTAEKGRVQIHPRTDRRTVAGCGDLTHL